MSEIKLPGRTAEVHSIWPIRPTHSIDYKSNMRIVMNERNVHGDMIRIKA